MDRQTFLKQLLLGYITMTSTKQFDTIARTIPENGTTMPVLFVGHGSPMNAIEENEFTRQWRAVITDIPKPVSIVCVSAHWLTNGTRVTAMERPRTIHDFGGFPAELYAVQYPAQGEPALARTTAEAMRKTSVELDQQWGLDHGTWSVVSKMYPDADVPVIQLSIDYTKPASFHFELAKELSFLRKKGVLVLGSGNMVHNLGMVDWRRPDTGYDWAIEMNETFKRLIMNGDHQTLIDYEKLGRSANLAIPTPDHYLPLLYTLALRQEGEAPKFFNDTAVMGSLTMTSVRFGGG